MPIKHHDSVKMRKNKENYLYAVNKKKRPKQKKIDKTVKRGDYLLSIKKKSESVPAPWKYDQQPNWI